MPNKRKRVQPQKWGLQPTPSFQNAEGDQQAEEEQQAAGTCGNKRHKCRIQTGTQTVCISGHLPMQPFFQLLFVGPRQAQPDTVYVSINISPDEAAQAHLTFSGASPDPHGVQVPEWT